ncbi:hypothetical protein ACFRAO_07560 [Streptomyces sp. NPDC056656]|uniref:DNA polymerase thumb domain-containing protein n=1 Tax=Streptomyces sp. NPDC056656 TaxID=3345895 RepID=UPI0036BE8460
MPSLGAATAKTLSRYGITTIGQLADTPQGALARILGKQAGRELAARARGIVHRAGPLHPVPATPCPNPQLTPPHSPPRSSCPNAFPTQAVASDCPVRG